MNTPKYNLIKIQILILIHFVKRTVSLSHKLFTNMFIIRLLLKKYGLINNLHLSRKHVFSLYCTVYELLKLLKFLF